MTIFRDPGRSSSPDGSLMRVDRFGAIRNWDFSLLAGIEGHDCGFVGACPAFPAATRRERQVMPLRFA